jgi:hypothetical protein
MLVFEEMWPIFPLPSYSLEGHLGIFRRKNWTMFFKLSSMNVKSCLECPLLNSNFEKIVKKTTSKDTSQPCKNLENKFDLN